jgi:hypothetical protein
MVGKDCSVADPCKVGACNATDGSCGTNDAADGTKCTIACMVETQCTAGHCSGKPRDCKASGPCFTSSCDSNKDACVETQKPAGSSCEITGVQCQRAGVCDDKGNCAASPMPDGTPCSPDVSCADSQLGTCQAGMCSCEAKPSTTSGSTKLAAGSGCAVTGSTATDGALIFALMMLAALALRAPLRQAVRVTRRRRRT